MSKEPLDVVDFVVHKGHGVRGLAKTGLDRVPDNYVQPEEERFDPSKVVVDESIPVIDVSDWDDPEAAKSICDAAARSGFFQIVGHGVSTEALDEVKGAVHRFFELPTEEKVKYKTEALATTGGAKLGTSFSPGNEKVLEWKDSLSLHYTTNEAASQKWPPVCRKEALDYYKTIENIIENLYTILLKGLGVRTGFDESKRSLLMGWIAINFNYYPYCPNPELSIGVGRHSDGSALTVLLQDDVGGLYVRAPQEESSWIHVPPKRGALVINIGDVLQLISNGKYKSVEHRVVTSADKDRVSVAVFASPGFSDVVGPLPEVVAGGGSPVYREMSYEDYCKYYFGGRLEGKKAIQWAMI
ncbi:hypothetical protein V2J09_014027 [Rumex salicifolius]